LKFFEIFVLRINLRMSVRSVTPVKQIAKAVKSCPGAPVRKTNSVNPGNLNIVIPPFEGEFADPRASENTVICKTPESKVRVRNEIGACPNAPKKKSRAEFME
jgi:hypothetical protein